VTAPVGGIDPVAPVKEVADKVVKPVVDNVTDTVEGVLAPVEQTVGDATDTVEDATGIRILPPP
jgi:hypothetical protein